MTGLPEYVDAEAFAAEVRRIHGRFTRELIEAFDLCPYARPARTLGTDHCEVLFQDDLELGPSLDLIRRLEAPDVDYEVVQLIYPRVSVSALDFEHFNAQLRDAHAARVREPVYVHAVFHPELPKDPSTPDSLAIYLRRAPDPTIQLLRYSTLRRVRQMVDHGTVLWDPATIDPENPPAPPPPSPAQRIASANFDRVTRMGPEAFEAVLADIRADRDRSYARLLSR